MRFRWTALLLSGVAVALCHASDDPPGVWTKPAVPLLDSDAAWKLLPPAATGKGEKLPTWARMLASALPRTTAAMLEFDRIHRLESPLEPKLRARLRWNIADVNRCEYTRLAAQLDLKLAGASAEELAALAKGNATIAFSSLPTEQKEAIAYVRQATTRCAEVTDEQFARLRKAFGNEKTVAMVLLTAGANWQDKLFLSLGVPPEPGGAKPALKIAFDMKVPSDKLPNAPARKIPEGAKPAEDWKPAEAFGGDWGQRALTDLRSEMEKQKARPPRIPVPTQDQYVKANASTPTRPGAPPRRVPKVVWSLVCGGYQPKLAAAWGNNTGSFRDDAKQDRVFEESLFWIVTRSIDCFY